MQAVFVLLAVIAAVGAFPFPHHHIDGTSQSGIRTAGARRTDGARAFGARPLVPTNPADRFGVGFYGQGLNNPYAFPVNQFQFRHVKSLMGAYPGTLARVDLNGEIQLTDKFGQEFELRDNFGREIDFDF